MTTSRETHLAARPVGEMRGGRIRYRETVIERAETAPRALMGLLAGENIGKMLVKVEPEP